MIDSLIIKVKSGDGGKGSVSFNKDSNNSRGGPDGGNGGNGGNVILRSNPNLSDLKKYSFKKKFLAENGYDGSKQNKSGPKGKDLIIDLPLGCLVWEVYGSERKLLATILDEGSEIILFSGGAGGRGNTSFVSSQNKEPLLAEGGESVPMHTLELDLRISSDLLLLGPPNSGKSTFLTNVSNAKPEIKDYPYTTKFPFIAVCKYKYSNIKIVELPGIENQKGLGMKYIKHIRSAKLFCFIIDSNSAVNDYVMSIIDNFSDFDTKSLLEKTIVVLTKSHKLSEDEKKSTCDSLKKIFNVPVFFTDNSDEKDIIEYVYSNKNRFEYFSDLDFVPTITFAKDTKIKVKKIRDSYEILDTAFVQLAEGSDLNNWKALVQFQYRMKNSNVAKELIDLGIKKGDKLLISDYEFSWED